MTSAVRDGSFHESIEVIYHSRPPPPGCNSDLQFVEILPVFSVYALETGIKQHFTENLLNSKMLARSFLTITYFFQIFAA